MWDHPAGVCLALAYPDRVARRRDGTGENWASVGGRGFRLDPASGLASSEWLAVGETQGAASGARILSAAPLDLATVEALFADRIETRRTVTFNPATGGVEALRERRLGGLRLSSGPDRGLARSDRRGPGRGVRTHGLSLLPWSDGAGAYRARAAYAGVALDDERLLETLGDWLPALVAGKRRLDAITPAR